MGWPPRPCMHQECPAGTKFWDWSSPVVEICTIPESSLCKGNTSDISCTWRARLSMHICSPDFPHFGWTLKCSGLFHPLQPDNLDHTRGITVAMANSGIKFLTFCIIYTWLFSRVYKPGTGHANRADGEQRGRMQSHNNKYSLKLIPGLRQRNLLADKKQQQ